MQDALTLHIFKNESDITCVLPNTSENDNISMFIMHVLTQEQYGDIRTFKDGNDLIVELHGISASITTLLEKLLSAAAYNLPTPTKLRHIMPNEGNADIPKQPSKESRTPYAPELLEDNVGKEEDVVTHQESANTNISENRNCEESETQTRIQRHNPQVTTMPRHKLVAFLNEFGPKYPDSLNNSLRKRHRNSLRDFVRFESDIYLREACSAILEAMNQ